MNKSAVGVLSFAVGAGSGILGTYLYMKRWADNMIDKTIQEFKAEYRMTRHSLPDDIPENNDDSGKDGENPLTTVRSSLGNDPVEVEKKQYHNLTGFYDKSGFMDIDELEDDDADLVGKTAEDVFAENEHPEDDDEKDVFVIDIDDYENDEDIYGKENLLWYTGDDTLVDSFGEVIEDTVRVVGDALDDIDWTGHDVEGDMIYVRNDILKIDYEIECIHAAHKDMIE